MVLRHKKMQGLVSNVCGGYAGYKCWHYGVGGDGIR